MQELTIRDMAWMDNAGCRGADSKLFFPSHTKEDSRQAGPTSYNAAKAICAKCEVINDCLLYALKMFPHHDDDHGMWGGMSPGERRKYRRNHPGMRLVTSTRNAT